MRSFKSHKIDLRPDETIDTFMKGHLKLIQSKTGYRFSIDAILLAEFVTVKKNEIVIDMGTGCGIIPMLLHLTKSPGYTIGLEIQEELADQAARNILLNNYTDRIAIIRGDIRALPFSSMFADVVVCNPPYRRIQSGRINPHKQKAIARHEILATLDDILEGAIHVLRPKGRLAIIYPSERLMDLTIRLRTLNLEPKRIRVIYPDMNSEAKLVMVEALLNGRPGLKLLPPLMDQGEYSIHDPS